MEREEFLNVGVVLLCAGQRFLNARFLLDEGRITAFCKSIDIAELRSHIGSFEKICRGGKDAGPIGSLTLAERFRWLTATRSTVIQPSKVHPGLCRDAAEMLERLFNQLVAPPAAD